MTTLFAVEWQIEGQPQHDKDSLHASRETAIAEIRSTWGRICKIEGQDFKARVDGDRHWLEDKHENVLITATIREVGDFQRVN